MSLSRRDLLKALPTHHLGVHLGEGGLLALNPLRCLWHNPSPPQV